MLKIFTKKIIMVFLAFLAKFFLRKKKLDIIGVTGSYGKTSVKDAIYHLLSSKYSTHRSEKSLNTEFGFPLAILSLPSGFSNLFQWLSILLQAAGKAFFTNPNFEKLVLEYGADKPGDITYLLGIAKPNMAVLTTVAPVHLNADQFASVEAVFEEKKKLLACLTEKNLAFYNGDHPLLQNLSKEIRAPVKTFGLDAKNSISATVISSTLDGITGNIRHDGKTYPFHFPILGRKHILVFLPALLIGNEFGIPIEQGIILLQNFSFPPGRMSKFAGIHGSVLLDSSYNASPETMVSALELLKELPAKRKIAVLGAMNELGEKSEMYHRQIGVFVPGTCDMLITVGGEAHFMAEEALKNGMKQDSIKTLQDAGEAGEILASILCEDDLVLFKGSQNMVQLERAIQKVLADPSLTAHLARQETEWRHHPHASGASVAELRRG